ncbi:acyl-CoA dehydrogenase family protein [Millisia brevis]|uniref:acyl-CoA dehydrogenase family protein n=1 Tax=Millisia brevis TaxID=264148 RepID=UPI00082E0891|nr:acyl-CoA dehydrogenase family protein [Millisia brevis]
MKLALSPEEAEFRDELRTFYRTTFPEDIRESNIRGELSRDDIVRSMQVLNEHGYAVPGWPVEWGGRDWSPVQRHIWLNEMQLAGVPEPLSFNAGMIGPVIATFGSQELKERFLPKTANLDIWWSQGFSEPEAGSDLASLRTVAVRDGDSYVVNGQKTWTTLGQFGDWIFCLVRTDPSAPKKQMGISMLLFPMDAPGVTVRPIELIDGGFEVNEVFLENVRVPVENLVGEENAGWTYAKFLLGNERTGIARVGETKRALAEAKALAAALPGGSLFDDPLFAARVAELENELLALEVTLLRIVASYEKGKPSPASSVLKLRGSQLDQLVTELVTDIAAADSLPVDAADIASPEWAQQSARRYLNHRKVSIYGGSNEIQRGIISSGILGL